MKSETKQSLFQSFLATWQNQFNQIPYILDLISSYPEINKHFKDINFLSNAELEQSQRDWVALVAKFEHPLERDFFDSCWVPVEKDGLGYFIDFSSGTYSIFETVYYPFEPYGWCKRFLFRDITLLFKSLEDKSINLEEELEENRINFFDCTGDLMQKREELGLTGKIKPSEVESEQLYNEEIGLSICYSATNKLKINGVTPFVVSLFPYKTQIELINFTLINTNNASEYAQRVTSIQPFVFLLSLGDNFRLDSFKFQFVSENPGYVKWENETLEIVHSDVSLLKNIEAELRKGTGQSN